MTSSLTTGAGRSSDRPCFLLAFGGTRWYSNFLPDRWVASASASKVVRDMLVSSKSTVSGGGKFYSAIDIHLIRAFPGLMDIHLAVVREGVVVSVGQLCLILRASSFRGDRLRAKQASICSSSPFPSRSTGASPIGVPGILACFFVRQN